MTVDGLNLPVERRLIVWRISVQGYACGHDNPYGEIPYQARSKDKRKEGVIDEAGGEASLVNPPF